MCIRDSNKYVRGNIHLTKVDSEYPDNKLTGATFEVYKDSNANGKLDSGDEPVSYTHLTPEVVSAIMSEEKPNQREKIVLRGDKVRSLIPKNIPLAQTEDYVVSYTHLRRAADALKEFLAAARAQGFTVSISRTYMSYPDQRTRFNGCLLYTSRCV